MVWTPRLSPASAALLFTLLASAVILGSGEVSAAQLTASWIDNSDGVAITRLERRLSTDATYVAIADAPPGATTFVDTSVSPATTYCYRAFAYDADAVSPYTDESCAAVPDDAVKVSVGKAGNGTGTIVSTPAGIACGTACVASFGVGKVITLAATSDAGATFHGWSGGGCVGTNPCTFASNTSVVVTASFSLLSYPLSVTTSGPGTVTSSPSGINCGSVCSLKYPSGTVITLTATPSNKGATFVGWSGDGCSGSRSTCAVSVQDAMSVVATFKRGKGQEGQGKVTRRVTD